MSDVVQHQSTAASQVPFTDRRSAEEGARLPERRQFANNHEDLSPPARELARQPHRAERRSRFVHERTACFPSSLFRSLNRARGGYRSLQSSRSVTHRN